MHFFIELEMIPQGFQAPFLCMTVEEFGSCQSVNVLGIDTRVLAFPRLLLSVYLPSGNNSTQSSTELSGMCSRSIQ